MTGALPEVASSHQQAPAPRYTHRQILEILSGLILALFVSSLSATVVGTALPTIVGELGGQDKLAWVASATLLTTTASTPLWGKVSDLLGRKRVFQAAIVVFVVASALAGLSQNMGQLIVARALQGIGAGGLQALSQAIIADIVSPRERGRYSGYMGASFGLATVAGPLLGGFLVGADWLGGWRACFYVGVPIAIVAFAVIQKVLNLPARPKSGVSVDYLGAALITGGVTSVLLMLSLGGKEFAWNSPWTFGLGGLAVVMLVGAVWQERRAPDPIIPPRLFSQRTVVLANAASFMVGFAMFGAMIYLPLYLQIVKGESPTAAGLLTLPLVLGLLSASISSGQIIVRRGRWKLFPVIGMLLVAGGLFLFSQLAVHTPLPVAALYMLVLGLGIGLTMQVLVLAVQNTVTRTDIGIGTSTATFFRSMGGAVGVAVFGTILNNRLSDVIPGLIQQRKVPVTSGSDFGALLGSPEAVRHLPPALHQVVVDGFADSLQVVFLAGLPVALVGWVAVLFLREVPLRTSVGGD